MAGGKFARLSGAEPTPRSYVPRRTFAQESAYSTPPRSPNPRQSERRKRGRKEKWGRLGYVRCYRQSHELGLMRAMPRLLHAGVYRTPLGCGFVKLTSSLALRIAAVCKLRHKMCLLDVGLCKRALAGHLEPNIHAHAYTQDTRNFVLIHPQATILDLQLYRGAWLEGVESAGSSSCKQERETGQKLPCGTPIRVGIRDSLWPPQICSVIGINPAQEAARPPQQVLCKFV
jgi:hypothetical protein